MDSLSPECTPLKRRYDSCFNAWFEGYLQPALDAASSPRVFSASTSNQSLSYTLSSSESSSSSSSSTPPKVPIKTSWAASIGRRPAPPTVQLNVSQPQVDSQVTLVPAQAQTELLPVDTRGMTRAQIKAAQYERDCGESWRHYRACLVRAIGDNQSLSTLLEAARDEHGLSSLEELQGTPWDPNAKLETN